MALASRKTLFQAGHSECSHDADFRRYCVGGPPPPGRRPEPTRCSQVCGKTPACESLGGPVQRTGARWTP
eukprot:3965355-Lingulodinium_polyedra.AAC.1